MTEERTVYAAMAFAEATLASAADLASRFAGDGGRIATMTDIVDARLAAPDDPLLWKSGIVTSSVEYVGLSPGGNPVAAVAHGVGPLADPDDMVCADFISEGGARPYRISDEEFRGLLSGRFGDIDVFDIRDAVHRRRFHLMEPMSAAEARDDAIVRARLGPRADEFIKVHERRSKEWRWDRADYGGRDECMIAVRDPSGYPYLMLPGGGTDPVAFPLSMTGARPYRHCHMDAKGPSDHLRLVTDLGCYPWKGRTTVIGIRGGGAIGKVHHGMDAVRRSFLKHWPRLLKVERRRPERMVSRALVDIDGLWFTQRPRKGMGIDAEEPEYKVSRLARSGNDMMVRLPYRGRVDRLVYEADEILSVLPPWSNAYRIVSEPNPRWLRDQDAPSHVEVRVTPYHAVAETRWFVPPMDDIVRDFERVMGFPLGT